MKKILVLLLSLAILFAFGCSTSLQEKPQVEQHESEITAQTKAGASICGTSSYSYYSHKETCRYPAVYRVISENTPQVGGTCKHGREVAYWKSKEIRCQDCWYTKVTSTEYHN